MNSAGNILKIDSPVYQTMAIIFLIFSLTLVGYVPVHQFRKLIYCISGIKIGLQTGFHWRARFFHPWNLRIGKNSIISNDAMLDASKGIIIGNNVSLSMGVWIWTMEHEAQNSYCGVKGSAVTIKDYAWISCRVVILPGVTIWKGAVVADGAIYNRWLVPAKKIGIRTKDLRYQLQSHKAFQ